MSRGRAVCLLSVHEIDEHDRSQPASSPHCLGDFLGRALGAMADLHLDRNVTCVKTPHINKLMTDRLSPNTAKICTLPTKLARSLTKAHCLQSNI